MSGRMKAEIKQLINKLITLYYSKSPFPKYTHSCGAVSNSFWGLVRSETVEQKFSGDEGASVVTVYYCKHCEAELEPFLESEVEKLLLNPDFERWDSERRQQISQLKASLEQQGFKIDVDEGSTSYTCPLHGNFIYISPYGAGLFEREAGWYRLDEKLIDSPATPCECVRLAEKIRGLYR